MGMREAGSLASSPAAAPILLPAVHLFSSSARLTAACGLGEDRAPIPSSLRRQAGAPGSRVMRCPRLARRCSAWPGKWCGGGGGGLLGGGRSDGRCGRRKVLTLCLATRQLESPRPLRPRRFPTSRRGGVRDKAVQGVMSPRGGALGRRVLPLKLARG